MPAPKDKKELMPWLKSHGYQWVLKSPTGEIFTTAQAIRVIEEDERSEQERRADAIEPRVIHGVYFSEAAMYTHHVYGGQHDDDTHVFSFFMDTPESIEERDSAIFYTFDDGVVLVQHDRVLDTEQEWKDHKATKASSNL